MPGRNDADPAPDATPDEAAQEAAKTAKTAKPRRYTIEESDTLSAIAQAHGVTRAAVLARNLATLDEAARAAGYAAGSASGTRLVTGTVIEL